MFGSHFYFALLAFFIFECPFVRAQEPPIEDINDVTLESLLNIHVSASSKIEQSQRLAPAFLSVLPKSQIKDYGFESLNEVLVHQPGFFASQDYDRRTVGSRGLYEGWNNNHLLLLVDGIPSNDPMYGTAYTWEITPLAFTKSVEIVRGPGSALYGSNATNGVIALQSLSGHDMNGAVNVRFRAGDMETRQVDVVTGGVRERWNYLTSFTSFQTNGNNYKSYDGSGRLDANGDLQKFTLHDDRRNSYFFAKLEGEGELKDFSLQYHRQSWSFQTGHGWLFSVPDFREDMRESRDILNLSYKPKFDRLSTEFTAQYQKKNIVWNTRYVPNGVSGYTDGVWEFVDFDHDSLFLRSQAALDLGQQSSFLLGIEGSQFLYQGDKSHFSNNDATINYAANPGNQNLELPGILGLIDDKPVRNYGIYGQWASGNYLSPAFQLTLGVRYDSEEVTFDGTKANPPGSGSENRTYSQTSPRIALIYSPSDTFSWKALAGRAFRAPAPSEIAGTRTWALANNIRGLRPEVITTYETGVDVQVIDEINIRANVFVVKSEDQIGYNASAGNLSTNIYTTSNQGLETEMHLISGRFSGFINGSLFQRKDETVSDATVTAAPSDVTWAPSTVANLGATYKFSNELKGALLTTFMGEQKRKPSDRLTAINIDKRLEAVPSWTTVDLKADYLFKKDFRFGLQIKNLFDQTYYLIKVRDFPFDYRSEGRTLYASLEIGL